MAWQGKGLDDDTVEGLEPDKCEAWDFVTLPKLITFVRENGDKTWIPLDKVVPYLEQLFGATIETDGNGVWPRAMGGEVMNVTKIGYNIWDDYYDDGLIPKGKVQETHGYVEEFDVLTEKDKSAIGDMIHGFLLTLDLTGVEVKKGGNGDIGFTHLTHERRKKLVKELEKSGLKYNEIPISFYSES